MTVSADPTSPRAKARITGIVYLLYFLTAVSGEVFVGRDRHVLFEAINLFAYAFYIAVTLRFYYMFRPVNRNLSFLAAFSGLVGLSFEVIRWQPRGMNIAIVFGGIYCLLIGYLIFRSTFLPRSLGLLMAFAGLGWLTYLSPPLVNYLSPYNLASALVGEGLVMLWLLVIGLNVNKWNELSTARRQ